MKRKSKNQSKNKTLNFLRYLGPGLLVTVGFIDPGNWASNIAAGSGFGYELLWMVTLSTVMLIVLQHNAAHLGIATGLCLSEAASRYMPRLLKDLILLTARPPFKDALFAALQHLLAIFVAIITPPLIIASALKLDVEKTSFLVSMSLFASGVSTFIQCRRFGPIGAKLLCIQDCSSFCHCRDFTFYNARHGDNG